MTPPRILIVEDDPNLSFILARTLKNISPHVHICEDGQLALDYLAKSTPDILLLDLHLPYVSGQDILSYVRDNPRYANTRILIVTADPQAGQAVYQEADLMLVKPVGLDQLRQMVQRLSA